MGTSATTSASLSYGASSNSGKEWYFIPEKCIKGCSVTSKGADGTISIVEPTVKGKASVTFNVSGAGTVSNFTWTSSNSKLKIGIPTRSGNVVTVPIRQKISMVFLSKQLLSRSLQKIMPLQRPLPLMRM